MKIEPSHVEPCGAQFVTPRPPVEAMGDRQGGGEGSAMHIQDDPMTSTMGWQVAKEQSTLPMMARDAEMLFTGIKLLGRHDGTSGCWSAHAPEVARPHRRVCSDYYGKFRSVAPWDRKPSGLLVPGMEAFQPSLPKPPLLSEPGP